jgi:hypothetical protein
MRAWLYRGLLDAFGLHGIDVVQFATCFWLSGSMVSSRVRRPSLGGNNANYCQPMVEKPRLGYLPAKNNLIQVFSPKCFL